jgi:parvulin-like peptidyl-prolyl isomerase
VEVTAADVRAALSGLTPAEEAQAVCDPALVEKAVRAYLVQRIVLEEAKSKSWNQSPEMQAQLQRVRDNAITENYLEAMSKPPDDYPGEAEMQAAYDASKPSLLVPRSYDLAQIYIAAPKTADEATLKKAHAKLEAVRKQLAAKDADFTVIAKAESEEPQSASHGGEIGWLTETQIQPEIRTHLPKLSLNVISEPIQLNDGWHILKVLDAREPYTPTLEQVRPQLRQQMRANKISANTQIFLSKLMESHPLSLNESALAKALQPPAKP